MRKAIKGMLVCWYVGIDDVGYEMDRERGPDGCMGMNE